MPTDPTASSNLHRTRDVDAGLPAIKPVEGSDLKAGDALAAEGKLDEALAVYRHYAAICQAKVAYGSSMRAADQLDFTLSRIGRLAPRFLQIGSFKWALECTDEALAAHPNSVVLNINRAHALMCLGRLDEAQAIYLRYCGKKMPPRGKSCDNFILQGFAQLRQVGLSHPLMDDIEKGLVETKETNQQSAETVEPMVEVVEPAVNRAPSQVTIPRLAEIDLGDQLVAKGKLREACLSYRRGLTICKAALVEDGTGSRARYDFDLVVNKIGGLAFNFLLMGSAAQALEAIEEALYNRPDWIWLYAIRAHALMCCANITEARQIYQQYCGKKVDEETTWEDFVRLGFDHLKRAGRKHPLMDRMEKEFHTRLHYFNLGST